MKTVYSALGSSLFCLGLCSLWSLAWSRDVGPFSVDGSVELEQRLFKDDSFQDDVGNSQSSIRLQAEFFTEWNEGDDRLIIEPFARLDSEDRQRTHTDIRQFLWTHYGDNYEFSAGIGKVFWGVTESLHLVDIINQTDLVENIDTEDKLGQPWLRYSYLSDAGTVELYLLPYFRERTFAGENGRLNAQLRVRTSDAVYESRQGQSHIDTALRYSHSIGSWDIGLAWFSGTSREPDLVRFFNPLTFETAPFYPQIDQFSADVQLTTGGWLVKLEAIQREHSDPLLIDYAAAIGGLEYTLVGLFGSSYDLGLLAEYAWDERGQDGQTPFQNDLFLGARVAFNDVNDSQLLLGYSSDLDVSDSRSVFIEAATRLAPALTINIELRYFDSASPIDPLFNFRNESFAQIGLEYFF